MSDDQDFDQAIQALRAWHYQAVRQIADDAIEACAGRLACVDPGVESIARDAEREGRDEDARRIRTDNPTHRVNREREHGASAREFLDEHVRVACDGHDHVIYAIRAQAVLLASDNEGAYEREFGERSTPEAEAEYAMFCDVWQILDARSEEWEAIPGSDDDGDRTHIMDPRDPDGIACMCGAESHEHGGADADPGEGTCTACVSASAQALRARTSWIPVSWRE